MAQKRYHEFQAQVTTPLLNMSRMGLLFPGRYAGFDSVTVSSSTVDLIFDHGSGAILVDPISGLYTSPLGVVLTQQGVTITEDGPITCFVDGQTTNTTKRIDLLVCDHLYSTSLQGGNPATYSVIRGPNGSYTRPAVPNPQRTIVLAEIHLLDFGMGLANLFNNGLVDVRPIAAPQPGGQLPGNPFITGDYQVASTMNTTTTQTAVNIGLNTIIANHGRYPFNFTLDASNRPIAPVSGFYRFDIYLWVAIGFTGLSAASVAVQSSRTGSPLAGLTTEYQTLVHHPTTTSMNGFTLGNSIVAYAEKGEVFGVTLDCVSAVPAILPGAFTGQMSITYLGKTS